MTRVVELSDDKGPAQMMLGNDPDDASSAAFSGAFDEDDSRSVWSYKLGQTVPYYKEANPNQYANSLLVVKYRIYTNIQWLAVAKVIAVGYSCNGDSDGKLHVSYDIPAVISFENLNEP